MLRETAVPIRETHSTEEGPAKGERSRHPARLPFVAVTSSTSTPRPAGLGRRLVGIVIDWAACLAITFGLIGQVVEITPTGQSFYPLLVLFVEHVLLVTFAGGSLGHRVLGMQVVPVARPRISVVQGVVRAALLCIVIPAVVTDRDNVGLHDRAAGTRLVRV
ncbi:RDD family protein [Janibacter melonis]|uniref:RDD family protein n=1 Tax=Janibacter melonis TaxID=262209 RepID=A0A5P8FM38_9MICO|nr:RDD family protein [Janibacter melonis]